MSEMNHSCRVDAGNAAQRSAPHETSSPARNFDCLGFFSGQYEVQLL